MLLVIFVTGAILWNLPFINYGWIFLVSAVEPGYLDFDNLPDTNFSCDGKVIGGYYADIETGCQMFHVCTIGQKSEITDIKFLCLNGTVFDQETRVCERLDEVDCSKSESFFDLNLELYGNNGGGYGIQPEEESKDSTNERNCEEEYKDSDASCKSKLDKETDDKDVEYIDWDEPATFASPLRVSSTINKLKPPTSTTRTPLHSPSKFHYNPASSTADPGRQLLALHQSFQDSVKYRDNDLQTKLPSTVTKKNSTFPISILLSPFLRTSNTLQLKSSPYAPLPNKLPSEYPSPNQKTHYSNHLANVNRTPIPTSIPINFKSDTPSAGLYKQMVIVNQTNWLATTGVPKHQSFENPLIVSYKIHNANVYHQDHSQATQSQPFRMQPQRPSLFMHPAIATVPQRPLSNFNSKSEHFVPATEDINDETEIEPKQDPQLQYKFDHLTFSRAIPSPQPENISVALSTSSVSSSISSKSKSAINNASKSGQITATNQQLANGTEEPPYYPDATIDYEDQDISQEYKDIIYISDISKMKPN